MKKNNIIMISVLAVAIFVLVISIVLQSNFIHRKINNENNYSMGDTITCIVTSGFDRVVGETGAYPTVGSCSKDFKKTGYCYEFTGNTTDSRECGPDDGNDCYIYRRYYVSCDGKCDKGKYFTGSVCKECPTGYTTNGSGKTSASDCNVCVTGYIKDLNGNCVVDKTECPNGQYNDNGVCKICSVGYYCYNNKEYKCPSGYEDGGSGAKSMAECKTTVSKGFGLIFTGGATRYACAVGFYADSVRTVNYGASSPCTECPSRYTTNGSGKTSANDCNVCVNGYHKKNGICVLDETSCKEGQRYSNKECITCGDGEWSEGGVVLVCSPCPAGYACKGGVKTSCTGKEYSRGGRSSCLTCNGTVKTINGVNTDCDNNSAGFKEYKVATSVCNSDGTISCNGCDIVSSRYDSATNSNIYTLQTQEDYLFANSSSTETKSCKANSSISSCQLGYYLNSVGRCEPCSGDTYGGGGKNTSCSKCPSPYTDTSVQAKKEIKDCNVVVPGGYGLTGSGSSKNINICPKGYYSKGGIVNYNNSLNCNKCNDGYTTNGSGKTSASDCNVCDTGYHKKDGKCVLDETSCKEGQRYSNKDCVACGDGEWSDGGVILVCSPCPAGYACKGGVKTPCTGKEYSRGGRSTCLTCKGTVKTFNGVNTECDNNASTTFPEYKVAKSECKSDGSITCDGCDVVSIRYDSATNTNIYTLQTQDDYLFENYSTILSKSCPATKKLSTCPSGYYLAASGDCILCESGNYCNNNEIRQCPSNYVSLDGAKKEEDCFMYVQAGYEIAVSKGDKRVCQGNTYYPGARNVYYGSVSKCIDCDSQVDANKITCLGNSVITSCANGEYLDGKSCSKCPRGYENSISGATSISQCYAIIEGQEVLSKYAVPTNCKAGSFQTRRTVYYGSTAYCSKCVGNTYSSDGAKTCINCDGIVNDEKTNCNNQVEQLVCTSGEYLENNECKKCPVGYKNSPSGATNINECYAIIEGEQVTKQYAVPDDCPIGYYQVMKYVKYGELSSCMACPENKTTISTKSKDITDCSICKNGYVMNSSNTCVLKRRDPGGGDSHVEMDACYKITSTGDYVYGKYENQYDFVKISDSMSNCNRLIVEKTTILEESLKGAKVILVKLDSNSNEILRKEYEIGKQEIEQLDPGDYYLQETISPTNYILDSNKINIKVGLDGTIYIQDANNIKLKSINYSRNASMIIKNELIKEEQEEEEIIVQDKCYIKHGSGTDNEYCIGNSDTCPEYEEIENDTCNEEPACYVTNSGIYIVGRLDNQDGYTYYGSVCPKCYVSLDGEYRFTASPREDEQYVATLLDENSCVSKNIKEESCYISADGKYSWGLFDKVDGYTKVDDINSEDLCINKVSEEKKSNKTIIYILLIIVILAIMYLLLTDNKKKKK